MENPDAKARVLGGLSYFSVLLVIPALVARHDPFVRFHLSQGLVLLLCSIAFGLLTFLPPLRLLAKLLSTLVLVFSILGIYYVCRGWTRPLPLLGRLPFIKP